MAWRTDVRDPIVDWFGEGAPGWIAAIASAVVWAILALAAIVIAILDEGADEWNAGWVVLYLGLLVPLTLVLVGLPVLLLGALIALVGRQAGWRVGEVMVAVPVVWVSGPLVLL